MNRKETLGRLLLTLLTAFVMVAGVFATAAPSLMDEASETVAVRELDEETRVMGEAPISAQDTEPTSDSEGGERGTLFPEDMLIEYEGPDMSERTEIPTTSAPELPSGPDTAENIGTRAASLSAGGPYGTLDEPKYEGEEIDFDATLTGDDPLNYKFRWEVTGDGVPDGPGTAPDYWGAPGDTSYEHTYLDNNVGEVLVQAWDGTYTTFTFNGVTWDGYDMEHNVGGMYTYTYGNQFKVLEDITVDKIGGFKAYFGWYYPYPWVPLYYENLRLWTSGGTLLAQTGPVYPTNGNWAWADIPDVTLTAGNSYVLAMHARQESTGMPHRYCHPGSYDEDFPGHDKIEFEGYRYRYGHDVFPSYGPYMTYAWFVDMDFYWEETHENTIDANADVFVDNVAPIVINPRASVSVGQEGSEVSFEGSFLDPGLDDEWEYRWLWGDGTSSEWRRINKWSGGGRVLFCTSWVYQDDPVMEELSEALGHWLVQIDKYNWYSNNAPPDLDYMLQYDVVVIGSNYIPSPSLAEDVGDRMAEYVEAGGNVVQMWSSFHTSDRITGRWTDDEYIPIVRGSLSFGYQSLGFVYDWGHPIMNGVSSMTAYYKHNSYGVTTYSTRLANYNTGRVLAAYIDQNHPNAPDARIAGLAYWPNSGYCSGDYMVMMANAVKWASQQPDPEPLPMPIALDPMSHIYVDDYPFHVTPEDLYTAELQVRDDDHRAAIQIGAEMEFTSEDFVAPFPPAGWTHDVWRLRYSSMAGGTSPEANLYWYSAYLNGGSAFLESAEFDTSTYSGMRLEFKSYIDHWLGSDMYECNVYTRSDPLDDWTDRTPWGTIAGNVGPGTYTMDISNDIGPATQILFEHEGSSVYMDYWYVDDVKLFVFQAHVMDGLGTGTCDVLIENVFPMGHADAAFTDVVDEMISLNFEGFTLTDPALKIETEEFWWRWDFEDDSPLTSWQRTNEIIPGAVGGNLMVTGCPMDFWVAYGYTIDGATRLLYNFLHYSIPSDTGTVLYMDVSWFGSASIMGMMESTLNSNFGTSFDWTYTTGTHDLLDAGGNPAFDVLYFGYDWWYTGSIPYTLDEITNYLDAGGHIVVTGDEFNPGTLDFLPYFVEYDPTFGAQFDGPAFTGPVVDEIADNVQTGSWTYLYPLHNYIEDYDDNEFLPVFADPDPIHTLVRPGEARHPKNLVLPIEHDFGDNGIFYVDLQLIDDDMYWDTSGGYPVYTGPAGEEMNWISHNIFPVTINNVDPWTSPLSAVAELDLGLRVTGEPGNPVTMTLWYDGTYVDSVTQDHQGNDKISIMPVTLDVGEINMYTVTVEYDNTNDDGGANPQWVFEGRFPDGKVKELKHEFNEDTTWIIGPEHLRAFLRGQDLIFTATGADMGSDDLAFVWQWGDCTPHGIHVYANEDFSMEEGVSQTDQNLFDVLSNREAWFDRPANDVRTPEMNPIRITDQITHAFDEEQAYFYYVALILVDDDVGDGYPSPYQNGGGYDMEYICIDLS